MITSIDESLLNSIDQSPRTPFKTPNPYEKPANQSFFSWLEEINEPSLEELEQEKTNLEYQEDLINA